MGIFRRREGAGSATGHVGARQAGGTAKGIYTVREDRDAQGRLVGFAVYPQGKQTPPDNYNR